MSSRAAAPLLPSPPLAAAAKRRLHSTGSLTKATPNPPHHQPHCRTLPLMNDCKEKRVYCVSGLGFGWTGRTGGGSRERTAEIDPSKTDGRDRTVYDRLTADDPDDVSNDVTDSGGGSAEEMARTAHARRRTAARGCKRRAPRRRGQRGELTGDLNGGGRPTDGDGDEEEAAGTFGSTTAMLLR
uniref:Uncharacterized protein n=1 Tax=Oryza sativa subsp. japonica TaxID=39947 RepID=Q8H4C9_ORYSJ|nr:hypothetical protein [Oryza sativa Japonica Group]